MKRVVLEINYVVSGDSHLLNLKEYRQIYIITAREFLDKLDETR